MVAENYSYTEIKDKKKDAIVSCVGQRNVHFRVHFLLTHTKSSIIARRYTFHSDMGPIHVCPDPLLAFPVRRGGWARDYAFSKQLCSLVMSSFLWPSVSRNGYPSVTNQITQFVTLVIVVWWVVLNILTMLYRR